MKTRCRRPDLALCFGLALSAVAFSALGDRAVAAPAKKAKPTWEQIAKVYDAFFLKQAWFHPQVLITQSSVEPLWNELTRVGWKLTDAERDAIVKKIPTDKEFFVRQLHTGNGRRFMRTVAAKYPGIYDKLDMLSRTDGGGKPAVSGLIAAPDAELTVKYMFSKGGKSSWASLLPDHNSFNKPTGRIYTAEELETTLKGLFEAAK